MLFRSTLWATTPGALDGARDFVAAWRDPATLADLAYKNDAVLSWEDGVEKSHFRYVIGLGRTTPQDALRGVSLAFDVVEALHGLSADLFAPITASLAVSSGIVTTVRDGSGRLLRYAPVESALAMAEHLAGSTDSFASLMNAWAAKLGMKDSQFKNPHGLDEEGHYSTARDMARLGQALIHDQPEEYKIYSQKSFVFNGITQHNRNRLLWDQSLQVDGIKTGHVSQVGYNLVSSATNNEGMRLIAVVMGANSEASRAAESKKLLTYGFRFFQSLTPYKAGTELVTQKIWMGDKSEVKLGVDQDVSVLVTRGQGNNLKADFQLESELKAPLAKGQRVGTVFLKQGDKEIKQVPLVALEEVQEGGLMSRLWDYLVMLVSSWFK